MSNTLSRKEIRAKTLARAAEVEAMTALAKKETDDHFAYKVLSCTDILKQPRPRWRIKGVLPRTGLASIFGPSRAGKSFLALDMAFALTSGDDWFGWQTRSCPVLYINLESSWGLQSRLQAWMQYSGNTLPEDLHFIIDAFNLLNPEHVNAIIQAAPQNAVIIIDTLNRATPGADENSSKEMSLIIKAATEIQTATNGLVILVALLVRIQEKGCVDIAH